MAVKYNTSIVRDGLVLYLDAANIKSYPGSGTTFFNISQNSNNATISGATYSSTSPKFFNFDGTDDYITFTRNIQDSFSLCVWFKTSQSFQSSSTVQWYRGSGLVDAEVTGVTNDFGMSLQLGKVDFGVGNPDVTIQSPLAYNDNLWHFAVGSRNRSTGALNLYVDGVLVATGTGNTNSLTSSSNIRLGSLQVNLNFFIGQIGQCFIYNKTLSPTEIVSIFESFRGRYGI